MERKYCFYCTANSALLPVIGFKWEENTAFTATQTANCFRLLALNKKKVPL
ncbi:hypothetical protein JCM10003_92 [Bacteroides pyogenes JCM 10003]|nr:hypothetical protein JCM10003_92 [Bacteroides pyogenes JCM 10003]